MQIRVIKGGYGLKQKGSSSAKLVQAGQTCEVDDAEAKRLVGMGVAEIATTTAATDVATPTDEAVDEKEGNFTPDEKAPTDEPTGAFLDPARLETMKNADLKKLADDMGIDSTKCRTKADFIAAICAVDEDVGSDDEEGGPDLGVEDPVQ